MAGEKALVPESEWGGVVLSARNRLDQMWTHLCTVHRFASDDMRDDESRDVEELAKHLDKFAGGLRAVAQELDRVATVVRQRKGSE